MIAKKELTFRLTVLDYDYLDKITFYSISNLFQEIASLHAFELGCGYKVMKEKNLAWIVARSKITLFKQNGFDKEVKVITWPHPNGRFDFDRDYLLLDKNNEIIAKGTSKWLVYNLERNFLCSSKGIMENIEFSNERVYEEKLNKIDYGEIKNYKFIKSHIIEKSDLDHYGHMNNAKYLQLMINSMSVEKEIIEVQIDYINQGFYNHKIDLYKKIENDNYFLLGMDEEKIIFVIKAKINA